MKILYFDHKTNYLSHDAMEAMMSGPECEKLLSLAEKISVCLHEDWKANLVREKGTEYQHFRPIKDAAMEQAILENKDEILLVEKLLKENPSAITPEQREKYISEDGKLLYQILSEEKDGKIVYSAKFDLIRVPFDNLSKAWQNANLDAAKYALCLVKTCIEQGGLSGDIQSIFENFEKMAHDVHIEWMVREGSWADEKLLLPYELLTVDTDGYNQKDKDRAHSKQVLKELTYKSNISARNLSIVERAITELFKDNSINSGLTPEIMEKIEKISPLIHEQNMKDYNRYLAVKEVVKHAALEVFKNKKDLLFEDLEMLSSVYFEAWKNEAAKVMELPKELQSSYFKVMVDDERVNYKNIARGEVLQILAEMMLKKEIEITSDPTIPDKVAAQNKQDYAAYLKTLSNEEQPGGPN